MTLREQRKVVSSVLTFSSQKLHSVSGFTPSKVVLQQKKYVIVALCVLNTTAVGLTFDHTPQARLQNLHAVEAAVASAQPATQSAVQPVQAPAAVTADVSVEKVTSTPAPTPKSAVAGVSVSRLAPNNGNWDGLLQQYFGSAWQQAKRVMMCESGGNANAINRSSGATGLMQIMPLAGRPSQQALLNPTTNISYAAKMYQAQGWKPWVCKP